MTRTRDAVRGLLWGAVAIAPMTAEFLGARRAGLLDELPPRKAIRSVAPRLSGPRLSLVSAVAHVLVGGGAGAVYGAILPRRWRGLATGALFGAGVWVVGYEVVMPAATELAPAHRDDRRRAASILLAHLIFGTALGAGMSWSAANRRLRN